MLSALNWVHELGPEAVDETTCLGTYLWSQLLKIRLLRPQPRDKRISCHGDWGSHALGRRLPRRTPRQPRCLSNISHSP